MSGHGRRTRAARKPLDVGTGTVAASFDAASAAWLSIGTPHPRVGFVELTGMPAFDERTRGNGAAVRAWREALTFAEHAFLVVEVDEAAPDLNPDPRDPLAPGWTGDGVRVVARAASDGAAVIQRWSIRPTFGRPRSVRVRLAGTVDRPALAEITELDPPPPTGATTQLHVSGEVARLTAEAIEAEAWVRLTAAGLSWVPDPTGGGASALTTASTDFEMEVAVGIGSEASADDAVPSGPPSDRLTDRALAYVRGCTALRVDPGERAIVTDHRILPLSWTRDAYWQALALVAADGPGDRERMADHLRWLWRRCERPDGLWVRSHHADGRRKDLAFQADQQLYPFIELADYWRLTGSLPNGVAWDALVSRAWEATLAKVDPSSGLIASHETAADDPAEAPFLAAAQILLWYAAERLGEVAEAQPIGIDPAVLWRRADGARAAFDAAFAAADGLWAYAMADDGRRVRYHDANDLPTALAPLWGFCDADDPGWRATMAFAFGPDNPGWFAGRRAGLGSIHTPSPWPLGDVQAWIVGRTTGDAGGADAALSRLDDVAFEDGMLPEAYAADGEARVRTWFAWPGAVLAALRLLDADERLEPMLRAARR